MKSYKTDYINAHINHLKCGERNKMECAILDLLKAYEQILLFLYVFCKNTS